MIKLKTIIIFSFLGVLFHLFSCEKDVTNVEVPIVQPQLVVASFLNPLDNTSRVYLSWSNPIFNNSDMAHHNENTAEVYIIKDGGEYKLSYKSGFYETEIGQMPIEVGEKYKLKVISDKSVDLNAETTIPPKPVFEISYMGMDSMISEKKGFQYEYIIYVKIKIQNPDKKGYYRIRPSGYIKTNQGLTNRGFSMPGNENRIIYGNYEGVLRLGFQNWGYGLGGAFSIDKIIITLDKGDETFYRYNNAIEHYSGIDVFTEPTQVYSNIENAFGVFCSYSTKKDSILLN